MVSTDAFQASVMLVSIISIIIFVSSFCYFHNLLCYIISFIK